MQVSRKDAQAQGLSHYCTGIPCVHAHVALRRVNDRVCTECDKITKAKRRTTNANEQVKSTRRESYKKHQATALASKKIYRTENKGKINALCAARKKVIKQRTPQWLTKFDRLKIRCMYQLAAMYTRENAEPWHVDHVIPLQGFVVSGLHVPNNLRVIRGLDNIKKKNKYEVQYG
tara:strand:- start:5219 stop:5743 length:525 start_codon:yes stop_codon:yes gene_type:complete